MARKDRLLDNVNLNALNERQLRVINAVDASIIRCLEKFELVYQIILQQKSDMNSNVVYLVWELIDWLERTRKLLGLGVGFHRKASYYNDAFAAFQEIEEFRHKLQNLDRSVNSSVGENQALLGSVTAWVHEGKVSEGKCDNLRFESYNLGLISEGKSLGHSQLPDRIYDPVDYVTLHLGTEFVNLSKIMRMLLSFYQQARSELTGAYPIKD